MYHKWQGDPAGVAGPDLDPATARGPVPVRENWSLCPSFWNGSVRGAEHGVTEMPQRNLGISPGGGLNAQAHTQRRGKC